MKSIKLQQIHQNNRRRYQLSVMPLAFGMAFGDKFKSFFQVDWQSDRIYALAYSHPAGHVDVLLVDYNNPSALYKKNTLMAHNCPDTPGLLNDLPKYPVRDLLTASRLPSVLDQIPIPIPGVVHPAISAQGIESLVRKPLQARAKSRGLANRIEMPYTGSAAKSAGGKTYRALVIDDNSVIQKSLELKLARLEHFAIIDFADSGESALEKAEAEQYDLIFLDVMIPGLDGYETCTQLRKKAGYKKTPIIMMSGKDSPLDGVAGIMSGCTTYLSKPVRDEDFDDLSRRMLVWLASSLDYR